MCKDGKKVPYHIQYSGGGIEGLKIEEHPIFILVPSVLFMLFDKVTVKKSKKKFWDRGCPILCYTYAADDTENVTKKPNWYEVVQLKILRYFIYFIPVLGKYINTIERQEWI